ncbi:MAG: chromosome partitioning protein ParB [Promethearchaeota archaeon]
MKINIPCLNVKLVDRELLIANNWNPNNVPRDRMELLKQSIIENGFCFPIVTIWDGDLEKYIILDGFHRFTICQKKYLDIRQVPIVVLDHDLSKRMAATLQFNRARGVHEVDLDAEVIRALFEQGLSTKKISEKLGFDEEAIHRYKSLTGIADLFKNVDYSTSWIMIDE